MRFQRTNYRQFELEVLGPMPGLGEVFTITHEHGRERYEVECLETAGNIALVERADDGPALRNARSAVLAENGGIQKRGGRANHEMGLITFRMLDEQRRADDRAAELRCWCGDFVDDNGMCVNDPSHVLHPSVEQAAKDERENWEQYQRDREPTHDDDFYDW